ncbi:hypothetical protein SAMN05216319_5308 [Duganella sp. CF402]|uniref:hypothetical protein n=1 Tax=unclassified Duganella TaxID=2636909 RepID=UPI0008D766C1|nr:MULTISPECIES: hypothetical protein [unclassified Duganella]RZT05400.1 hypothetical protein EV582_3711 [Duganella sp. BK701]SEN09056.1 hypothetical protein SAMN05216319_5308 [Duganella sp. CF402]
MAAEKVLLMQGPTQFPSRPLYPEMFYPPNEYDARYCITQMARVYRALGYKIVYSGWLEDEEWLNANRELFDYLVVSDQHQLNTESSYFGNTIGNNKDKLYYAALQGLRLIRAELGDHALVFRVRADVTLNQRLIDAHLTRIAPGSGDLMIEYCNVTNMMSTPDFLLLGESGVMATLYEGMFQRSVSGAAYHVSSHIDHMLSYLLLQQQGLVGQIVCMSRQLYDTLLWRGVPRYFHQDIDPGFLDKLAFDTAVVIPAGLRVEDLIARIPPEATGNAPLPPKAA